MKKDSGIIRFGRQQHEEGWWDEIRELGESWEYSENSESIKHRHHSAGSNVELKTGAQALEKKGF